MIVFNYRIYEGENMQNSIYIVNYTVSSKKDCDYILISDLHGYFNTKLAEEIRDTETEFVIVSGDILNGYEWTNQKKLNNLRNFLFIIAEKHPIVVALGNHDLFNLSKKGFNNFKKLQNIKDVYPIYNETIILKENRFTNFLPTFGTFNYFKQGSKRTINRLLKCLEKIEPVSKDSKYVEHLVAHNPYHFYDEKMIREVSKYDFIETGHFHDGWIPTKIMDKSYEKYIDKGIHEIAHKRMSFTKGNSLVVNPRRNLSRGITYVFKDGYVVLLPDGSIYYYENDSNEYFKKDVSYLIERLDNKKCPALVISGAINTFGRLKMFYPYVTHVKAIKESNNYKSKREIRNI